MKNTKLFNAIGGVMTMGLTMRRFTLTAVACGMIQVANAQVSITQIVPVQLPNQQGTELKVLFNGLTVQPKAYQLEGPSRLVLDFEGAGHQIAASTVAVASNEINDVEVQSDNVRSRLVVNLKEHGAFTTRTEGNTFILKVSPILAQSVNLPTNLSPTYAGQVQTGLQNIGFQKGGQGEGLVNIDLLNSQTPVDVKQQGSKIVIRLLGTKIPTHLARRLNVNEFATPVTSIDAYNEGSNGVIVIQPTGSYEYMAFQAEDKLTISVKRPVESGSTPSRQIQNYTGKKVSLDFQDIEVRRVLQLLADFTGTNIVAADTVQGFITLRLKDVPSDQALDIILKSKNLDKRQNGNVVWVAPVPELIKAEEDEAKALAQSVKLAPIQTDYIQLKYAKVADVEKLITEAKNQTNGGNQNSSSSQNDEFSGRLLSPRGSVSMDHRTNTLIVNDTAKKIDEIRKMVDLIDIPVKQVMIEARIVRATNNFSKDLGVKWGVMSQGITSNNHLLVGGSDTTLWDLKNPEKSELGGYTYDIERPSNLNVDLGVTNPAGRIAFGLISLSDFMLDLELSAAEADGHTEIVSTPKVLTADKQKAVIKSGRQIPYQSVSAAGGTAVATIEFIDATLTLDVTPSITPDGKVSMQLNIAKDGQGPVAPNGELTIDKNQIQTNVLVNNGETVVLGGVFENETGNSVRKVPVLGDLPWVGGLFRTTSKVDNKNELLIFVTPRIVNDNNITNR